MNPTSSIGESSKQLSLPQNPICSSHAELPEKVVENCVKSILSERGYGGLKLWCQSIKTSEGKNYLHPVTRVACLPPPSYDSQARLYQSVLGKSVTEKIERGLDPVETLGRELEHLAGYEQILADLKNDLRKITMQLTKDSPPTGTKESQQRRTQKALKIILPWVISFHQEIINGIKRGLSIQEQALPSPLSKQRVDLAQPAAGAEAAGFHPPLTASTLSLASTTSSATTTSSSTTASSSSSSSESPRSRLTQKFAKLMPSSLLTRRSHQASSSSPDAICTSPRELPEKEAKRCAKTILLGDAYNGFKLWSKEINIIEGRHYTYPICCVACLPPASYSVQAQGYKTMLKSAVTKKIKSVLNPAETVGREHQHLAGYERILLALEQEHQRITTQATPSSPPLDPRENQQWQTHKTLIILLPWVISFYREIVDGIKHVLDEERRQASPRRYQDTN